MRGVRAIQGGALAIGGGSCPIGGSLGAHQFELLLQGRMGLGDRPCQLRRARIAIAAGLVSRLRDAIPLGGRQVTLARRMTASKLGPDPFDGGRLALAPGPVVRGVVGARARGSAA